MFNTFIYTNRIQLHDDFRAIFEYISHFICNRLDDFHSKHTCIYLYTMHVRVNYHADISILTIYALFTVFQ